MRKKLDPNTIVIGIIGIIVHIVIVVSIFDVYFKSPLIHGMRPIDKLTEEKSPAKRLVLIVADGLRADTFFDMIENDQSLYMRYFQMLPRKFIVNFN